MYYFSMFLVIIASAFYHISQKSISGGVNPAISITVTYAIALVLSLGLLVVYPTKDIMFSFKELNWASYVLGVSIFVIEIAFLLVYRSGWDINIAALFANVIVAIILIFIGLYILKEQLSIKNVAGIILSIVGLILMQK